MRFSSRLLLDVVAPAFFICWAVYLAYDAVVGAAGFRVLRGLEAEVAARSAEVDALAAERRRLQIVAAHLNPKSLDPDMVEEKIRSVLGYVADGDVVIPRDQLEEILRDAEAGGR